MKNAWKYLQKKEVSIVNRIRIDEELIKILPYSSKEKQVLQKWIGCTVEEALDLHSKGWDECVHDIPQNNF